LGKLSEIINRSPKDKSGIIEHDGIEFDQAYADVKFAGKNRRIGVFGSSSDTGVIDVTEDIVKGLDGHPTFISIKHETKAFLKDFYEKLSRQGR